MNAREEFLLKMYEQLFFDINRHIMVVWQSVGVLIGAFTIFALVEKQVIPLGIAASIIILLSSWLIAHLIDSAYWYNRNLVMIANIERQFLNNNDLKEIHYYFGKHRPKNKMIDHLKIQFILAISLSLLVVIYHIYEVIYPGLCSQKIQLGFINWSPYMIILISAWILSDWWRSTNRKYEEFLQNSPGKKVNVSDIEYGVGHGHKSARSG